MITGAALLLKIIVITHLTLPDLSGVLILDRLFKTIPVIMVIILKYNPYLTKARRVIPIMII